MRKVLLSLLLLALLVAAGCAVPFTVISAAAGGEASGAAAEMISFHPSAPEGRAGAGLCRTSSLAVWRGDAWRCTVGNRTSDPCSIVSEQVICGAEPATGQPDLALGLLDGALDAPATPRSFDQRGMRGVGRCAL